MSSFLLATVALMSGEAIANSIDVGSGDAIPGFDSVDKFEGRYIARNPLHKKEVEANEDASTVVSATTIQAEVTDSVESSDPSQSVGVEVSLTSTSISKASGESSATESEPIVDGGITTIAYSGPTASDASGADALSGFANAQVSSTAAAASDSSEPTAGSMAGEGSAGEGGSAESGPGAVANAGAPGAASPGTASPSDTVSGPSAVDAEPSATDAAPTDSMETPAPLASGNSTESVSVGYDSLDTTATASPLYTIAGNSTVEPESTSMDSMNSIPTDVAEATGNTTASVTDAYGGGVIEVSGTTSDGIVWENQGNIAKLSFGTALIAFLFL